MECRCELLSSWFTSRGSPDPSLVCCFCGSREFVAFSKTNEANSFKCPCCQHTTSSRPLKITCSYTACLTCRHSCTTCCVNAAPDLVLTKTCCSCSVTCSAHLRYFDNGERAWHAQRYILFPWDIDVSLAGMSEERRQKTRSHGIEEVETTDLHNTRTSCWKIFRNSPSSTLLFDARY